MSTQPAPTPLFTAGLVSGERTLSAADFEQRVLRAASGFAALGVRQGDCVALLLRNDFAFLEASLAAVRIGAYAVPINWHFKAEEVGYVLADCGAKVLVAHADLLAAVADAASRRRRGPLAVETPPEIAHCLRHRAGRSALPHGRRRGTPGSRRTSAWQGPPLPQTSSMIYTSGTTGRPKGVRRQPLTADLEARMGDYRERVYGLTPGVRTMIPGPLYHSAPNAFALRAARVAGLIALMPRFDPEAFLALVEKHRIEAMFMVPTMFVRLLKLPAEVRNRYDLSSLQFVMHAAAPCPPDIKRAMIDWLGPVIHEFYGSTESGAVTVVDSREWLERPGTVGRPIKGGEVRIYDDAGERLGPGQVGEVLHPARVPARVHLPPTARQARRDRSRGLHHQRRRRLSRRGRLPVPVRPQARHGDLGRRQHLSRRDRGGADQLPGRERLRRVRHPRQRVRRGADGGDRSRSPASPRRRSPTCAPTSASISPATRCPSASSSGTTCRARTAARSSSAACAIPTGRMRGGRFELCHPGHLLPGSSHPQNAGAS